MNWKDTSEIVEKLEEQYAEEEIPETLDEIEEMVKSLDEFVIEGREDDEEESNEQHLTDIQEAWIELRNNNY